MLKYTCPQVQHIIFFPRKAGHPVGHNSEIGCIRSDQQGAAILGKHGPVHERVVSDEGEHTVWQGERGPNLLELHVVGDALKETGLGDNVSQGTGSVRDGLAQLSPFGTGKENASLR